MIGIPYKPICTTQSAPPATPSPPTTKKFKTVTIYFVPIISSSLLVGELQSLHLTFDGNIVQVDIELPDTAGEKNIFKGLAMWGFQDNLSVINTFSLIGGYIPVSRTDKILPNLSKQELFQETFSSSHAPIFSYTDPSNPYILDTRGVWIFNTSNIEPEYQALPTYVQYNFTGNFDSIRKDN